RHDGGDDAGREPWLEEVDRALGTEQRRDDERRQRRGRDLAQDPEYPRRQLGQAMGENEERGAHRVGPDPGEHDRGPDTVHRPAPRPSASAPAAMPTAAPTRIERLPAPHSAPRTAPVPPASAATT